MEEMQQAVIAACGEAEGAHDAGDAQQVSASAKTGQSDQ
jgi:hypothetical protein